MTRPIHSRAVRHRTRAKPAAGLFALGALALGAQAAWAQNGGLRIDPTFTATQTFTDNVNLSATDRRAESITVLSPGIRISSHSGRIRGSLDFSLNATIYARDTSASSLSRNNNLAADTTLELVDQWAFLDARASIGQQAVSAFGTQSTYPAGRNPNSTEQRTLSLSPYVRGRLFGEVNYNARLTSTISRSAGSAAGDQTSHAASVGVNGGAGLFGWGLDASRSISDFDAGRRTTEDRAIASVFFQPDVEWRFALRGGTERNDVITATSQDNTTWGGGVTWRPGPRTQFDLQGDRRYYGNSHSLSFSHRMRRSAVAYSDSRSATDSTSFVGVTLSVYDIFFAQFASLEPDPILRDVLVRNFLRNAGLNPNERVQGGFLSAAVSVQRSRTLSLSLQGQRNSLVVSAFSTSTRRLDNLSGAQDDLSQGGTLSQQGLNASLSHRLSPTSAVVASVSEQRTPGIGAVAGNSLRSLSASWSETLGQRTSMAVTARHTRTSGPNAYDESTVTATYSQTF